MPMGLVKRRSMKVLWIVFCALYPHYLKSKDKIRHKKIKNTINDDQTPLTVNEIGY
jgi:hypothetical protein